MRSHLLTAAIVASLLGIGTASAQTAPPAPAPAMDKAALSKSCSTKADQQNLHGKARKRFRSACRRGKN